MLTHLLNIECLHLNKQKKKKDCYMRDKYYVGNLDFYLKHNHIS